MKTSEKGVQLICNSEGLRVKPYRCQGGLWTIGYGHTKGVKATDHITMEGALIFLKQDLKEVEALIRQYVKVPLTQNQYDALACFIFNVGVGHFKDSTLLKKLNAKDYQGAGDEFLKWNKVKGEVSEGLTKRRETERKLFLS